MFDLEFEFSVIWFTFQINSLEENKGKFQIRFGDVCVCVCVSLLGEEQIGEWVFKHLSFCTFFTPRTPSLLSQHLEGRVLDWELDNLGCTPNFFLTMVSFSLCTSVSLSVQWGMYYVSKGPISSGNLWFCDNHIYPSKIQHKYYLLKESFFASTFRSDPNLNY